MAEFGDLIGIDHSTISRYEAGTVEPSRTVWTLLFLLASKDEREAILESMGEIGESALAHFEGARESLKLLQRPDPNRKLFAEASAELVASKEPIEPPLIKLVKLYPNKKVKQYVAQMVPYLEFLAK
jgi:transcriptional regulator with XRE-family HTH domain